MPDDVCLPESIEPPESRPPPGWRPPGKHGPIGRSAVIGIVALVGLGALGNLIGRGTGAPDPTTPTRAIASAIVVTAAGSAATSAGSAATSAGSAATSAVGLSPDGPTVSARVIRVIDGDTIVVAIGGTQYHLRYIGMDTPESVKPDTPVQPMALAATAANKALVDGKSVILETDVSETDQYDRLLRDVWVERNGGLVLVGLELVRTGFAQVTTYPPDVKYVDLLLVAQAQARTAAVGLWAEGTTPTPVPTDATGPVPFVTAGSGNCHRSYSPCLPIVDDLDCADVRALGKAPVTIKGPDDYRLDRDGDGLGCE